MKKVPGSDDTSTEMAVAEGDIGVSELTKLSNIMYRQGIDIDYTSKGELTTSAKHIA